MADGEYRRLSCRDCDAVFSRLTQRGRLPVRCEPCAGKPRTSSGMTHCAHCGGSVPVGRRLYCSDRCCWSAKRRNKTERRQATRAMAPDRRCQRCDSVIGRKSVLATYCSSNCKRADWRRRNPDKTLQQRSRETRVPSLQFCAVSFNKCQACGSEWTARRPKAHCSRACELEMGRRSSLARSVETHSRGSKERYCKECGASFTPAYGDKKRAYCGAACAAKSGSRVTKAARRAKMRNLRRDPIDPIKVFERDGWRCRLCGCDTPRKLRGTNDPRAPELDHLTALAAGGTHTMDNVACMCRRCNGLKGVMPFDEATKLFGPSLAG